jgi:hypothetical protein
MIDANGNRNGQPQVRGDSPAFPVSLPGAGDNGWHGMSLRDWFAGLAMQGGAAGRPGSPQEIAEFAYRCADFMIAERTAPNKRAGG